MKLASPRGSHMNTLYEMLQGVVPFKARAQHLLRQVNALEATYQAASDDELRQQSRSLRYRAMAREPRLSMLPEAFAIIREAARRKLGMRHFDVQILGAVAMCQRSIAEMQTGEGKTLTATLPLYLYSLAGKGAHLATVNDYLARRDAEWMRPAFDLLDVSVGVIEADTPTDNRREAYACDITYGTAKEFGFDYLRDRLLKRKLLDDAPDPLDALLITSPKSGSEKPVGRGAYFALVDEADSILIDDAGTPLIISSLPQDAPRAIEQFQFAAEAAKAFVQDEHFTVYARDQRIELTAEGRQFARSLPLPDALAQLGVSTLFEDLERALRVMWFYQRDRQYVVGDGEIHIVDEFTGRIAEGRKWRDGIHQAVEAKESLKVVPGGGQAARITVQDFFLRYPNLAGMTGTASTAARELRRIYRLNVSVVPTNRPPIRKAEPARIFCTADDKWAAIVDEIRQMHAAGRPVIVGTRSIDKSLHVSSLLRGAGITHQVLNAHEVAREAEIVAQAGQRDKVTVSTNMAGRGTDIKLGPGVAELGGLHVICTELHDAARIDRQLIGRCGRQGDPGSYRQYLALDDDILLRGLGVGTADKLATFRAAPSSLERLKRVFYRAQRLVERRSFQQRRALLWQEKEMKKARLAMGLDPYLDAFH
jgi:preprotein translocase subunit SecA